MSTFDDLYREALGLASDEDKKTTCNDARAFTEEEEAAWRRSLQGGQ